MHVGGIDILLYAPAGECIVDVLLRACKELWRGSEVCFQDGGSTEVRSLNDPWVWRVGTTSREFFVYRGSADADLWRAEGAVPANANTMFHFLIGDAVADGRFLEVDLVVDKRTPAVRRFVQELRSSFLTLTTRPAKRGAPGRAA